MYIYMYMFIVYTCTMYMYINSDMVVHEVHMLVHVYLSLCVV